MIRPDSASITKPATPSWALHNAGGAARVARSRPANPAIAISASSDSAENPATPGRRMISTPTNPPRIISQRHSPTLSPKITAAPSTTTSGVACKIADAVEIGVSATASA